APAKPSTRFTSSPPPTPKFTPSKRSPAIWPSCRASIGAATRGSNDLSTHPETGPSDPPPPPLAPPGPSGMNVLKYLTPLLIASQAFGGTIRYAEDRAPGIIQPMFATTMSEARIHELIFDGLYTDDLELRSTPRLARGATLAEDRMSMDIQL